MKLPLRVDLDFVLREKHVEIEVPRALRNVLFSAPLFKPLRRSRDHGSNGDRAGWTILFYFCFIKGRASISYQSLAMPMLL